MENELIKSESNFFEDSSHQNGMLYWYASDLLKMLGYSEFSISNQAIQKAFQICSTTGIDASENIVQINRDIDGSGKLKKDFKLSRFACYLVSMNADIKKPNVAKFQAYFARFAETLENYIRNQNDIERVTLRQEITDQEKSLASTVKMAGIQNYALFQNKGYLGLYNMNLSRIKSLKGIPDKKTPFDFMGAEELGANIFRITQTDAKIKRENVQGQNNLEKTAFEVGQSVRNTIKTLGGTMPEDLPTYEDIKKVKADIKKTNKIFAKQDKISKK